MARPIASSGLPPERRHRCSRASSAQKLLGLVVAPFLPETKGKPLPETVAPALLARPN